MDLFTISVVSALSDEMGRDGVSQWAEIGEYVVGGVVGLDSVSGVFLWRRCCW